MRGLALGSYEAARTLARLSQPSNGKGGQKQQSAALNSNRFDRRRMLGDDSGILFAVDINASAAILDLNTGIVTLLFTDIEGSTEKWEQEPERMADALARHDVLLRTAVEAHRGRVIKTTGDGIYAAFDDAAKGLNAAIAIQQSVADPSATAGMSLPVRCGLHAGPAHERDNEFFGGTINRAARIMGSRMGAKCSLRRRSLTLLQADCPLKAPFATSVPCASRALQAASTLTRSCTQACGRSFRRSARWMPHPTIFPSN